MMKNKKISVVLSCLLAFVFMLSACGTGSDTGGGTQDNSQPSAGNQQSGSEVNSAVEPSTGGNTNSASEPSSSGSNANSTPESWDNEQVIRFTYNSQFAPTHARGMVEQAFIDLLYEKTGGTVIFEPYWSASLFSGAQGWEEVMAGTADAAHVTSGASLDHFIVEPAVTSFIASAPLTFREACQVCEDIYYMTPELQKEWEGCIPIAWDSSGGELYIMSTTPIRSLEDIKGKTFRTVGTEIGKMIELLGGIAVTMPLSEALDSMSKGIIDGTIQALYNMKDSSYIDLCKSATGLGTLSSVGLKKFISETSFNKMSPRQQEAFLEAAVEHRDQICSEAEANEKNAIQFCNDNGAEIIRLTESEYATIRRILDDLAEEEAEKLNNLGYDGSGIYANAKMLVEQYVNS